MINEARVPQTGDCPNCGHKKNSHSSPSTGDTICYGSSDCTCSMTFPFVEEANLTGSWNRMSKDIRIDGLRELGVPEDFIDIVYRLDFGEISSQYPEIAEWMKESGDITGIGMWNEDKKADPINEWQTGNQMIPTDSEYQTSHFDWANPKLGDFESKAREEIDWSYDGQEPDYDPEYDAWSVFDDNEFTEDDMFAEKELGTADPFNIDWTTPDPTGMAKDEFGNPVKSHPSQYTMGGWDWEEKERMKSRGDVDFDPLIDNPQFNFESFQKKYSMCKGCMQNALEKLSKSKEYVEPVFHNYWTCPDCGQEDMTKTMGSDMMPWVDDVTKHYVNSHGMTEEEAKGWNPKTELYDGDSKFDQVWKDWNTNSVQVSGTPDEHMIQDWESKAKEDHNDDLSSLFDLDDEIPDLPLETIRVPDITPADVVDQYGNPDPNPSHIFPKSSWNFPSCPNCGSDDVSTDDIPRYAEPTWEEGEQIRLDCYNCGSSFNLNAYNATSYESKASEGRVLLEVIDYSRPFGGVMVEDWKGSEEEAEMKQQELESKYGDDYSVKKYDMESKAKEDWDGFDDDGYYVGTTDDVQQDLYNMTSHDYSEDLYMKWQGILTEELQRKGALKPDFQGYSPDAIYEWLSGNGLPEDLIYDLASEFGERGGQTSMGESKAKEVDPTIEQAMSVLNAHPQGLEPWEWNDLVKDTYNLEDIGGSINLHLDELEAQGLAEWNQDKGKWRSKTTFNYESKSSEGGDSDWVDDPDEWGFNTFDEEGQTVYREIDTNEEIPMTDPRVMRRVLGNHESKDEEDKLSPEELKKYKGRLGGDETLTESQLLQKGNESYKVLENNSSIRFE